MASTGDPQLDARLRLAFFRVLEESTKSVLRSANRCERFVVEEVDRLERDAKMADQCDRTSRP